MIHVVPSIALFAKSLPMALLRVGRSASEGRAVYLLVCGGVASILLGGLGFIAGML